MADARVIPLGDGDRVARLAASRAARKVGATGPGAPRPRKPRAKPVAEATGYAEPDQSPPPAHIADHGDDGVGAARGGAAGAGLVDWLDFLRRRLTGEYAVDDIGFDAELTDKVVLAALRPLYEHWFRVQARGIENIPDTGGALVVANHSGTIALDAAMTQLAVHDHHPAHRDLRMLGANLVFSTPFVGELARKAGHTLACNPDAERLLADGQVVGVWPEGFKGVGKPFADRYKLQRFGRGGFVAAALR
ncbi:MAG: 1-acyl-sn-glycerol-3-phosphate acyltransferase, partial [Candidatus Nanopelagicales bacterium]